jgi:hypothetical protein
MSSKSVIFEWDSFIQIKSDVKRLTLAAKQSNLLLISSKRGEMMFEELEKILIDHRDHAESDEHLQKCLSDFFMTRARHTVDWTIGSEKRTAAHVLLTYLSPESIIWHKDSLEGISPVFFIQLLTQCLVDRSDEYGESPIKMAYLKSPIHPLIITVLQEMLRATQFNPSAAEELMTNPEKRHNLASTLKPIVPSHPAARNLMAFFDKIDRYGLLEEPRMFARPVGDEPHSLGLN